MQGGGLDVRVVVVVGETEGKLGKDRWVLRVLRVLGSWVSAHYMQCTLVLLLYVFHGRQDSFCATRENQSGYCGARITLDGTHL